MIQTHKKFFIFFNVNILIKIRLYFQNQHHHLIYKISYKDHNMFKNLNKMN